MDKQTVVAYMVAILETLKECNGAPSGHLYAALMGRLSLHEFEVIVSLTKSMGYVSEKGHFLSLTDEGMRLLASACE